jgi:predicted AlkP superfamily pyrophosphatase or phosphodiesterase
LKVDDALARLTAGLKARGIDEKVNLIITSDHGMAAVDLRKAVFLDDFIDFRDAERILWTNEIIQIFPKTEKENEIIEKLKSVQHASCWRKAEIPARFHYNNSPRIAPVVCSTEEGWITTSRERYADLKKSEDLTRPKGGHGYDNRLESMRAIFIARGAAFEKGKTVEPFENVDVYYIMTQILNLTPARNDGNPETAKQVLRREITQ